MKQRQLFPYIFIAMSLLGALPAIYFAGSHKRRTQGWDSQTVLETFKHNLFLSIATNSVRKSTKDHCSFIMSGLEETLTETLAGKFELLPKLIFRYSDVDDFSTRTFLRFPESLLITNIFNRSRASSPTSMNPGCS